MKKFVIAAALLLSASTAYAGESYSFEIGGRTVRIHAPTGCDSASCISISIPGVYNSRHRDSDDADAGDPRANDAPAPAAVPAPTTARPVPPPPVASAPAKSAAAPMQATPAAIQPAPAAGPPAPQLQQQAAASATGSSAVPPATVVATAPAAAPAPAPVARPTGPLGMWLTEKKEGRVRIEECGTNLCGYSIDARTGQNKEKVLINMKPSGSKWSGRIYDPNSGSTYSSTIAMRGTNALRVQGCAFGGLFCGGQTWTRVD
ncbi:MAG TPA: DUF2147 domain-containing protein [Nitrobacter sp.]|nr:DUF2147 domain-containing protein [Nitrobacter sp.]